MMLVGVIAFNVLRTMDPTDTRAVGVLFVGYFFQGTCVGIAAHCCALSSAVTNTLDRHRDVHDVLLFVYICDSVRVFLVLIMLILSLCPQNHDGTYAFPAEMGSS